VGGGVCPDGHSRKRGQGCLGGVVARNPGLIFDCQRAGSLYALEGLAGRGMFVFCLDSQKSRNRESIRSEVYSSVCAGTTLSSLRCGLVEKFDRLPPAHAKGALKPRARQR
jgi:hypothetical protein